MTRLDDLHHARADDRPEVVEVEVERLGEREPAGKRLRRRIVDTVLPILLAMVIDAGDLGMGFVPLALPVGLVAGYLFSGYLDVAPTWRIVITCVVGLYLALPFTNWIPLATIIAGVSQFLQPSRWREEPFG